MNDTWRVAPSRLTISPGGTQCVLVAPVEGQVGIQIKPLIGSSGTLEVLGVSFLAPGYTNISVLDGASLSGTGFVVDATATTSPLRFNGPAWFTLNAIGATIVVTLAREISVNK